MCLQRIEIETKQEEWSREVWDKKKEKYSSFTGEDR